MGPKESLFSLVLGEFPNHCFPRSAVQAAIAEARQAIGLEQITLRVSTSSNSAIRLYERVGFQGCGVLPHAIKLVEGPGQVRYHDKLTMILIL